MPGGTTRLEWASVGPGAAGSARPLRSTLDAAFGEPYVTERRLAAIMFTDIVGYTALMARDEEAAREARSRHEVLVRPLVSRYDD